MKSNILLNTTSISLSQKSRGQGNDYVLKTISNEIAAGLFSVSSCQCGSLRPVPPPNGPQGVGPSPSCKLRLRSF